MKIFKDYAIIFIRRLVMEKIFSQEVEDAFKAKRKQ